MDTRVLLIKPGDVLLIGNVGDVDPEGASEAAAAIRDAIGVRVFMFTEDIDIDKVPAL